MTLEDGAIEGDIGEPGSAILGFRVSQPLETAFSHEPDRAVAPQAPGCAVSSKAAQAPPVTSQLPLTTSP